MRACGTNTNNSCYFTVIRAPQRLWLLQAARVDFLMPRCRYWYKKFLANFILGKKIVPGYKSYGKWEGFGLLISQKTWKTWCVLTHTRPELY